MNAFPVIAREVRSESRQNFTYWMRVICACVMLMGLAIGFVDYRGGAVGRGTEIFGTLHSILFTLIWILGALMTCDVVSRERRDGTIGLSGRTSSRPGSFRFCSDGSFQWGSYCSSE